MRIGRRDVDVGVVAALAWIFAAIGITVLLGPHLGLRGWAWLTAHHLLCAVGSGHELRRGWTRHRARLVARQGVPQTR